MISSFFGKTKPLNLMLLVFALLALMVSYFFQLRSEDLISVKWPVALRCFLWVLLTFFLAEFINRKNVLTKNNHYMVLILLLFLCSYPQSLFDEPLLISNLFVLLAFRRLISFRSGNQIAIKIFDATLWIGLATLFYGWASLFILMVYLAIFIYSQEYYKNLLIPVVAIFTVLILMYAYSLYFGKLSTQLDRIDFNMAFYLEKYRKPSYLFPTVFYAVYGVWALGSVFSQLRNKGIKSRLGDYMVLICFLLSVLISLVSETLKTSELTYMAFPIAVIMAKHLQAVKRKWIKETILWTMIAVMLTVSML